MALIACPECGHQVSDQADSCPSCAFPLRGRSRGGDPGTASDDYQRVRPVQTIEQTGKPFKSMQLFGCLSIIVGIIVLTFGGGKFAAVLFFVALVLLIAGSMGGWWHHG
jgi:uncharacterized membrane protein YvbJ